ncbi:MAG: WXG100 family type VII secretion target [Dermatophilaceae bacterium]
MSIYSYDSGVARDAEASLGSTAASLEATLADLSGFVNRVCANWEGDEQVVYRGIQLKWDAAAEEVRGILTQIKAGLGENTASVDSMRSRVRSTLQG